MLRLVTRLPSDLVAVLKRVHAIILHHRPHTPPHVPRLTVVSDRMQVAGPHPVVGTEPGWHRHVEPAEPQRIRVRGR